MRAKEYRAIAREKLSGHWGEAVLTALVAALLGGIAVDTTTFSADIDLDKLMGTAEKMGDKFGVDISLEHIQEAVNLPPFVLGLIAVLTTIAAIWGIATFILGGPTRAGYCQYNIDLQHGESKFSDLFVHYDIFLKAFLTDLLMTILIVLQFLLLIVPGIIATFAYQMTFYILAEHPEMDPIDAIKASRKMMKGHKWQLFCLQLSFIGWAILSMFTMGIGGLFLTPYSEAATAAFYKEISKEEMPVVTTPEFVDVAD